MKNTKVDGDGRVQWNPTDRLENFDFADDVCLLAHTKDMEARLHCLVKYASQVGLRVKI